MNNMPKAAIDKMAHDLAESTSHPEFTRMIREVRDAPLSEQNRLVKQVATVENVLSKGIPIPDGFRITTRIFEDPELARSLDHSFPEDEVFISFDGVNGIGVYQDGVITVEQKPPVIGLETTESLQVVIQQGIEEISEFVAKPEFQSLLEELYALPEEAQYHFVLEVLLNSDELTQRKVVLPEGMLIQRSAFGDGRPTLFCISKYLPLAYPWKKVTVTFDTSKINQQ